MAIEINGKTYRNLQEQVFENVEDIEDLQEAIAELPETTYDKTQIDNKDAAVLAEAKAYTYSKTESDNKYQTISGMSNYVTSASLTTTLSDYVTNASLTTDLATKVDKFVPTAGAVANIELYDEEDYANLFIGVKGENEALYKNYVSISSDGDVNIKADESFTMGVQNNNGTVLLGKDHDMEFTAQSGYDVNFKVGGSGKVCVTKTGQGTLTKKEIALKEDIIPIEANPQDSALLTLDSILIGNTIYSIASGGGGTSRSVGIISADAMDIYGGQPISEDKQTILEQYGYSGIDYDNKFYMLDSYTSNTQVYKNGNETITYNRTTKILSLS